MNKEFWFDVAMAMKHPGSSRFFKKLSAVAPNARIAKLRLAACLRANDQNFDPSFLIETTKPVKKYNKKTGRKPKRSLNYKSCRLQAPVFSSQIV